MLDVTWQLCAVQPVLVLVRYHVIRTSLQI